MPPPLGNCDSKLSVQCQSSPNLLASLYLNNNNTWVLKQPLWQDWQFAEGSPVLSSSAPAWSGVGAQKRQRKGDRVKLCHLSAAPPRHLCPPLSTCPSPHAPLHALPCLPPMHTFILMPPMHTPPHAPYEHPHPCARPLRCSLERWFVTPCSDKRTESVWVGAVGG